MDEPATAIKAEPQLNLSLNLEMTSASSSQPCDEELYGGISVRMLRSALTALKPLLYQLGMEPSRIGPYIEKRERNNDSEQQKMAYDYLVQAIKQVVRQYELQGAGKKELAAQVFMDKVLSDQAPPSCLPCFMQALVFTNYLPESANTWAWLLHDVVRLASVYMPLQIALLDVLSEEQDLRHMLDQLVTHGLLTYSQKTEVLKLLLHKDSTTLDKENTTPDKENTTLDKENTTPDKENTTLDKGNTTLDKGNTTQDKGNTTLDKDNTTLDKDNTTPDKENTMPDKGNTTPDKENTTPDKGNATLDKGNTTLDKEKVQSAVVRFLTIIYQSAIGTAEPSLNLPGSEDKKLPSWLDRLLLCVEGCEKRQRGSFRNSLSPHVLSSDTWRSVSDQLLFVRNYRARDYADRTQSGADESDISDFRVINDNSRDDNQLKTACVNKLLPLNVLESGELSVEEVRQQRTAQFVNSNYAEVIEHTFSNTPSQHGASAPCQSTDADDSVSVVTKVSYVSTENNSHVADHPEDTMVQSLARNFRYAGLSDNPDSKPSTILLQSFQEEIMYWVRAKRNVAIFLPTGTGKTFLVLKYVQELVSKPEAVVRLAFCVPTVRLAEQQYRRFLHFFPNTTYLRTGRSRSSSMPFSELLKSYQVFVMTPMCVVEAAQRGEVKVSDFSLLVLDECHHTVSRNSFKTLMDMYMDTKLSPDPPSMPQVIGLTASPGAGRGDSVEAAVTHIKQLCWNMDVERIATVKNHVAELKAYTNEPKHEIHKCSQRAKDGFKHIIEGLMKTIEDEMVTCQFPKDYGICAAGETPGHKPGQSVKENLLLRMQQAHPFHDKDVECQRDRSVQEELRKVLSAPSLHRGTIRYMQWVSKLFIQLQQVAEDDNTYSFLFSCLEMLSKYHESLILNEGCESHYALNYLQTQARDMQATAPLKAVDTRLLQRFYAREVEMEIACRDGQDFNPKLRMLEEVLLTMMEKNQEKCACMVFVKTIEMTRTIQRWIQDHPDLKTLNPGRIIGSGRGGGMSQQAVSDELDKFHKGDHQIVICTSAGEEGLDIQSCNVVIRYSYDTNMISMIQTRVPKDYGICAAGETPGHKLGQSVKKNLLLSMQQAHPLHNTGRARRLDSQYCVLGGKTTGSADREKAHLVAEHFMRQAIHQVQTEMEVNPNAFLHYMNQQQKADWESRKQQSDRIKLKRRVIDDSSTTYQLLCRKCRHVACLSSDIRLLGTSNRLVIEEDFQNRWKRVEKKGKTAEPFQQYLEKVARAHCKQCSYDWGCVIRHTLIEAEYPLLKLESFFLKNLTTGKMFKSDGDKPVKWAHAPFTVEEITHEQLASLHNPSPAETNGN